MTRARGKKFISSSLPCRRLLSSSNLVIYKQSGGGNGSTTVCRFCSKSQLSCFRSGVEYDETGGKLKLTIYLVEPPSIASRSPFLTGQIIVLLSYVKKK